MSAFQEMYFIAVWHHHYTAMKYICIEWIQKAPTKTEQMNHVFNNADSWQAAATAASVLREDAVFEDKASLKHALKTHAALHWYDYKMKRSNATTFISSCRQHQDADSGEGVCPFCL